MVLLIKRNALLLLLLISSNIYSQGNGEKYFLDSIFYLSQTFRGHQHVRKDTVIANVKYHYRYYDYYGKLMALSEGKCKKGGGAWIYFNEGGNVKYHVGRDTVIDGIVFKYFFYSYYGELMAVCQKKSRDGGAWIYFDENRNRISIHSGKDTVIDSITYHYYFYNIRGRLIALSQKKSKRIAGSWIYFDEKGTDAYTGRYESKGRMEGEWWFQQNGVFISFHKGKITGNGFKGPSF